MNKQEVIEKIEACKSPFISEDDTIFNYGLDKALSIIKQLAEPKKPVVPQFVAEYIEYCKHEKFYALHGAYANMDDRLQCWRFKGNNSELFAKAWLYGYEVDKEKRYTVEIPNPHGLGHTVLVKDMYRNTFITHTMNSDWRKSKVNQLTEAEIKKDFEWAWRFAKDVKE
jgi:hypothetical protein